MAEAEYYGVQPTDFRENETRWEGVVASGQVNFPFNYNVGYVDVWVDGLKKAPTDFTATTGNSIVIPTATDGQKVCLLSRRQVPITAYPNLPVINNPTLNGTVIIGGAPTDSLTFNNATVAWAAASVAHSGTHTFSGTLNVPTLVYKDVSTKSVNSISLAKALQGDPYSTGVTSPSSTGDVLVATFTPPIISFVDGSEVRVRAKATNSSSSPTLKVDDLAAKTIVKGVSESLLSGDLVAGYWHEFRYDATLDKWILLNPGRGAASTGKLLNVRVFTASTTYTPTEGTKSIVVEAVGGGGGGASSSATNSSQYSVGGGGSSGSYGMGVYTGGFSSVIITVGNGGVGAVGSGGAPGGTTSFGSLLSCPGGPGNLVGIASSSPFMSSFISSGLPNPPSGANLKAIQGFGGTPAYANQQGWLSGSGGSSPLGVGGAPAHDTMGGVSPSGGYGGGGSGGCSGPSSSAQKGGDGAPGVVIVWEYA